MTLRVSVAVTSIVGMTVPVTETVSRVAGPPAAANDTSTPAPARTTTRRVPTTSPPRWSVTVYSPTGRVLKLYRPLASADTLRLKPLLLDTVTLVDSPAGTLPYRLPVVLWACTAPAKHRPSAMQRAVRFADRRLDPDRETVIEDIAPKFAR